MTVALTDRDQALVRAAWSLGSATGATLRALAAPRAGPDGLRRRLRRLRQAGYLTQTHLIGPAGHVWLYGAGPKALVPGEPRPWRPGLAQVEHTLAVGDALTSLTRPGFAAPLLVTDWQGEAELRAWALPGAPYPDARVTWRDGERHGAWLVELDRGTESRAAWRRKLLRYLTNATPEPVLAVTTSTRRAAGLASVAVDLGVHLLATTTAAVSAGADPDVFDARSRRRAPLSTASAMGATPIRRDVDASTEGESRPRVPGPLPVPGRRPPA